MPRRDAALAADLEVAEVAAGAALDEPQPAAAFRILALVDEPAPVEIGDVPARARADEPRRHDRQLVLVEAAPFVELLAVHEPPLPPPAPAVSFSWTSIHSGKRHTPIPRTGSPGAAVSGGGA